MSQIGLSEDEIAELRRSRDRPPTSSQELQLEQCRAASRELRSKRQTLEQYDALDPGVEETIDEIASEIKQKQRAELIAERKTLHEKILDGIPDITIFGVSVVSILTFSLL
ncbi:MULTISPECIES: hypothetical protein [Halomicrobium]|uniref:Uncharacterized protein n=1 Tax=Halomicrobium mukohataei TaxID=57705 RepID=A0A4D6KDN4_9EURY|nr:MULTISPECIES: hypothetical protein [Halomicrobium]QCD66260.1 hypothetical protein E5139_11620 [Halomicrobium mukohataei]QFR21066.1 hypothetical protein GBQ70_11615 [Halomicrobium sp. ZPS1]